MPRRRRAPRPDERGQAAAEHVSLLAVLVVLASALGALAAGPVPGRVVAALAGATAQRVPPRHDDAWALTSPTWGPTIRRYAPRLVLERDVHGEDASVPVDPRGCRARACAAHGVARPTVFVHLKRRGVPTELLLFPGEGHELSRKGRPRHRLARFEHVLRWWARWLPTPANPAEDASAEAVPQPAAGDGRAAIASAEPMAVRTTRIG